MISWVLKFFQTLCIITSLFVLADARLDDYNDNSTILFIDPFNHTEVYNKDELVALSTRLNCSTLVFSHKGVKIEEILTESIYKPEPPSTEISFEAEENTFKGIIIEYENSTVADDFNFYYFHSNDVQQENYTEITYGDNDNFQQDDYNLTFHIPVHTHEDSDLGTDTDEDLENSTDSKIGNDTYPDCTFAFASTGDNYNWFTIIAQCGGIPGQVNATGLTPKGTVVLEPCHRPVINTSPPFEDLLYEYEIIEFERFYRYEKAFLRFAGTPSEFVDIIGQLVWAPDSTLHRYYRLSYRKDDTGFYVDVHLRQKCVFEKNPLSVECYLVEDFSPCFFIPKSLSFGLQASLIG